MGVVIGVALAVVFLACAVIASVYFFKKNKILGIKLSGSGVSFDNPAFFRRQRPANDTLEIIANEATIDSCDIGAQGSTTSLPKPENLQPTPSVAPALYELRLGTEGAGFKRFA